MNSFEIYGKRPIQTFTCMPTMQSHLYVRISIIWISITHSPPTFAQTQVQQGIITCMCKQAIEHSLFSRKNYSPSVQTPPFEIYYSTIRTPTLGGAQMAVDECLLAFDSLCGSTVRVPEHHLAYYRCFQTSTTTSKTPTFTAELERELANVHYPSTVSAKLEWGLSNVD